MIQVRYNADTQQSEVVPCDSTRSSKTKPVIQVCRIYDSLAQCLGSVSNCYKMLAHKPEILASWTNRVNDGLQTALP